MSLINNYILINTYYHQDNDLLNITDLKWKLTKDVKNQNHLVKK